VAAGSTPNIYHLVELKDTYHRFVVVLVNEHNTRILEVHLGAITETLWAKRPELRERVGRGWTQEHYQSHRRERSNQYAHEIARFVDGVMLKGGYAHLMLAGAPKMTALLRQALPRRLSSMLIDVVPASANDGTGDVVAATLASFIEQEQQESLAAVDRLLKEICRHGLAVAGSKASLRALKRRQVDLLVLASEYVPEPAWVCVACDSAGLQQSPPAACPSCGSPKTRELNVKEELVRLAELAGCGVEIVHDSETLMRLGGVGCLLRFLSPAAYGRTAA
jgi:peptide subunit release factor 1 (eRF1)